MKIEHIALNVNDPVGLAAWYCKHLGMRVIREGPPPANARFLVDSARSTVLEIYSNASAPVPDYASMDPLTFHIAFCVDDVEAARNKLISAGATPEGEVAHTDSGDALAMLRDPWGLVIQLMQRAQPLMPEGS